jgi:hypothetical protein
MLPAAINLMVPVQRPRSELNLDPASDPKIELVNRLQMPWVEHNQHVPVRIPEREYGLVKSCNGYGIAEAFADDNTAMDKLSRVAICSIKSNLDKFVDLSGLKCNVDKSMIMITGNNGIIPDYITNSGFTVTEKLHILGMDITKDSSNLFGFGFYLDIYYGFVTASLRISKKYITVTTKKGGLGMINVGEFLSSLKCTWIKKCHRSKIDFWRKDIDQISNGYAINVTLEKIDLNIHPILLIFE